MKDINYQVNGQPQELKLLLDNKVILMITNLNWNKERFRTRDRLLEYDSTIMPLKPHSAGLPIVYPWENNPLSSLSHKLFLIAQSNGYTGNEEDFLNRFSNGETNSSSGEGVNTGTINTFPVPGIENQLYLDIETEILYYFKIVLEQFSDDFINKTGAEIVGRGENGSYYLYIPVRTLPIEPLLLNCGSSSDLID